METEGRGSGEKTGEMADDVLSFGWFVCATTERKKALETEIRKICIMLTIYMCCSVFRDLQNILT